MSSSPAPSDRHAHVAARGHEQTPEPGERHDHPSPAGQVRSATSRPASADGLSAATVLPFHRHKPAITITKQVGVKMESLICPCKVCGKVMEFPVEATGPPLNYAEERQFLRRLDAGEGQVTE